MATEPPLLLRLQSDARLAALAAGGYRLAFAALAHRHRPALLRAARRLGAGEEAEDLVQQTLLAAWQALSQGAKVHSPRAWLFAILRHLQAVQARRGAPWAPIGELPDNRSVEDQVANRLELRELVAALRSLPEHQRAALLAQTLAGASRKELSESLGVSEAGVRSLLYRARATLRAGLTALTPLLLLKRLCASEPALAQSAAELPAAATAGAASLAGKAAIALLAIGGAVGGITAGSGFTARRGGRPRPAPAPARPPARGAPRPEPCPPACRRRQPRAQSANPCNWQPVGSGAPQPPSREKRLARRCHPLQPRCRCERLERKDRRSCKKGARGPRTRETTWASDRPVARNRRFATQRKGPARKAARPRKPRTGAGAKKGQANRPTPSERPRRLQVRGVEAEKQWPHWGAIEKSAELIRAN